MIVSFRLTLMHGLRFKGIRIPRETVNCTETTTGAPAISNPSFRSGIAGIVELEEHARARKSIACTKKKGVL